MRRSIVGGLVAIVVVAAGAAVATLRDGDVGPLPSREHLRTDGFAVWPQDTIDEGLAACDNADDWRHRADATALRFARDVLSYPEPFVDPDDPTANSVRYLVSTEGVRGVFLGSIVDLRRYDKCWFIVGAQPREGGFLPSVSFVDESGRTHVVIDPVGETEIGFGLWSERIQGRRQVVLELPALEPDATGHIMSLSRNARGIATRIDAAPLGFVPESATTEVASVKLEDLARTPGICRSGDGFRSPRAALADLYSWTFDKPIPMRYGKWKFKGANRIERRGDDRWLLTVDRTQLEARVPNLKENCWRVTSVRHRSHVPLKSLHVGEDSFTFDLRWGTATSAKVILGSTRGGDSWRLQRLQRPITVFGLFSEPLTEPFYVTVVLREGRPVVSAQYSWYRTR